jgi:arsenate reductase-like glutaredoxin family protein
MENITLKLDKENFPQLLGRYSPEKLKEMAVNMALKQYSERPITEEMLYSCLANLESDLEGMFS